MPPAPVAESLAGEGPQPSARLVGAAVGAGLLALVLLLIVVPGGAPPTSLDQWVFDLTADWTQQAPWAVETAASIGVLTDVAASSLLGVVTTVLLLARRLWVFAAFVAACGIAGVATVVVLKAAVGRSRPPGAEQYVAGGLDRSFPSGHAGVGVYLYGAIALLLVIVAMRSQRRAGAWLGVALFSFGIVIGLSRIVIGVHWATDVLAGWSLASLIVLVATIAIVPQRRITASPP